MLVCGKKADPNTGQKPPAQIQLLHSPRAPQKYTGRELPDFFLPPAQFLSCSHPEDKNWRPATRSFFGVDTDHPWLRLPASNRKPTRVLYQITLLEYDRISK